MFDISYPVAFVAGLVSFFAPCVVPLLPAYIAYVAGFSINELKEDNNRSYQKKLFLSAVFYIIGFSLIFVLLGTAAAGLGFILRQYQSWIQVVGGILIIIFGLQLAGWFHLPIFNKGALINLPVWVNKFNYFRSFFIGVLRPFFLGVLFAMVWTPCVGVVLGSILTIAAVSGTAFKGALLLFIYSLGIAIPFLVVALTLAHAPLYLKVISRRAAVISRVAGLVLTTIGILLATDTYKFVNSALFDIAFKLGYQVR